MVPCPCCTKHIPDSMDTRMTKPKVAVLSGKGGTGKTLLAVNLAEVAGRSLYLDCDVEEPNGHLFFRPAELETQAIQVKIPQIDADHCDGCKICVDFCKFNALAFAGSKWILFEEICHSCGGCTLVCPQHALLERDKTIGQVQNGISEQVCVYSGFLNPGEASGIPIIKKLLAETRTADTAVIIDCPPGSACIVMESIKDADYCLLVAEPTIFGAHNLQMVHELVTLFHKPCGVVLNKCQAGDNPSERYCVEHDLPIVGRIDFDPVLGRLNSDGKIAARVSGTYNQRFSAIWQTILEETQLETAINS